jgi:hypothetical protein
MKKFGQNLGPSIIYHSKHIETLLLQINNVTIGNSPITTTITNKLKHFVICLQFTIVELFPSIKYKYVPQGQLLKIIN